MLLSWILFGIGNSMFWPYFSIYVKMLGGSDFHISLVFSLGEAATAATIIFGGYLTDVIGRRRTIVVTTWGVVIVSFLYAIAPDWRWLLTLYVIDCALHFYQPALFAIIMESVPPHFRMRASIFSNVVTSLPWMVFPVVGGLVIDEYGVLGMRIAAIVAGCCGAAAATLRLLLLKETVKPVKRSVSIKDFLYSYIDAFRVYVTAPRTVKLAILASLLTAYPLMLVRMYAVVYATDVLGMSKSEWGIVTSAATAASIVGSIAIMVFADRVRRLTVIVTMMSANALSIAVMAAATTKQMFSLGFITCQIVLWNIWSAWQVYLTDATPAERRGRIFAINRLLTTIGNSVSGLAAGCLYTLNPPLAFSVAALIAAITTLYVATLLEEPMSRHE